MSKATIGIVAKQAGVSVKTVSRVLNNEASVRESTRIKVQDVIDKLNYSPNLYARRLRTNQSYLLGVIYVDVVSVSYANLILSGALSACDEQGYDLLIRPIQRDSSKIKQEISQMVERSKVDGFIITPPLCDYPEVIETIESLNVPYVRIAPFEPEETTEVHCREFEAAKLATEHLISLGHTHIAIVNYLVGHASGQWRYQGFEQAMNEAGIAIKEEYLEQSKIHEDFAEKAARRLLNLANPPTAIFAFNDAIATVIYRVAQQMGIKIPYQLSIVGFDDDPLAANLWPPLTTIKQPITYLGKLAALTLIKNLLHKDSQFRAENPKCELILRHSTGPVTHP